MTNNTEIYWEANGLSLHTSAWSVSTFGGRRYAPAPKRGSDLQLPLRQGSRHIPKVRDSQEMSLEMWMLPLNQDGTRDPDLTQEQMVHKNWRTILNAVDVPGQFPLVKRWYDDDGDVQSATAMAEFIEGMEPSVEGGRRLEFTLDLLLADPYFYGAQETEDADSFTAKGDVPTDRVVITLVVTGNARVDMSDGNWFTYTGPAGTLHIDAYTGIVKRGSTPVNGLMSRNKNFASYAIIKPGTFDFTWTSGISSGTVAYYPAYR